jgi:hypothetical protein
MAGYEPVMAVFGELLPPIGHTLGLPSREYNPKMKLDSGGLRARRRRTHAPQADVTTLDR